MAKATATLEVNNSGFKRGFDDMRKQTAAWSSDVKGMIAGAFAFGAIASFVSNFVSSMARVKDLSDRLGQSTDTIQRIGNAAKLSGSDLESVIKVLTKLTLEANKSGEAFAKIGISAAEFASANPEQQVLMLAKAYEEASGNQQKMLDLMALLGPKGQDIMIMLAGGVEELNKQLNQVPVVSETAINAMANLDDAIDSFTQHAHESLGAIIGMFGQLGAAVMAVYQTFGITGFDGNGKSFVENMTANMESTLDQKSTAETKKGAGITTADDQKKADDDKAKEAAAAKALEEEMTNLARSRMNDEQKITDLKREQAELAAAAQDKSKSDVDRLNAAREVLRVQQEIESIQKRVDDAAAKADEEAEKAIADFYGAEAKAQEEAEKEAEDALKEAYEAEAKAAEEAASSAPTIVSSSLASIGGGGSSYVSQGSNPALVESRKQTALLQRLVANTGGTAAMATNSPF